MSSCNGLYIAPHKVVTIVLNAGVKITNLHTKMITEQTEKD